MSSNIEIIRQFLAAWAAQDVDRIMQLFAADATFIASTGPEPGCSLKGQDDIRAAIAAMFKATAGMAFAETGIWGDGADWFATWTLSKPGADPASAVKGIDHFVVTGGRIDLKDAYRKVAAA